MKRISFLPSLLTCGNFSCGFIAIALALQSMVFHERGLTPRAEELFSYACWCIFIGMIFDMFDGRVARMTGATSKFGGELDSLADSCSFGVVPAALVYSQWARVMPEGKQWYGLVLFCGVIYAVCAILRLARYNVESGTADKNYFNGLPSPAAAGAVVSATLFLSERYLDGVFVWIAPYILPAEQSSAVAGAYLLAVYMLLMGMLMVSRERFVHVTNKYVGGRRPFPAFVLLLFVLFLLFLYPAVVLFVAFNGYVLLGLLGNLKRRLRPGTPPGSSATPILRPKTLEQGCEDE